MRQEERRARTRAALLRAAAAGFAERGYDGASIDAVAASVGLSKGAVYAHFPSKLELYLGVVGALLEQAEWRLERVCGALRSGLSALESSREYLGLGGDAQHAALMSELWRTAAIEPQIRLVVEHFVDSRLGMLSRAAVERGQAPAAALELAETVARFIDAGMLYRRVDDATRSLAESS
ncbi:MAG: helix-turn-helix domain-containing protein [bacterium]